MRSWAGRELLMNWGNWIRKEGGKSNHKLFKTHIRHKKNRYKCRISGDAVANKLVNEVSHPECSTGMFIYLLKSGSKELWKGGRRASNCWVCVQAAAARVCGWLSALMRLHLCEPEGVNVCLIAVWFIRRQRQRQTLPDWVQQAVNQRGWVRTGGSVMGAGV